jgi:hypothetical protein
MTRLPLRAEPFYPTASELARAAECVGPWSLGLAEQDASDEWGQWGHLCHAGAEVLARGRVLDGASARPHGLSAAEQERYGAIMWAVEKALDSDFQAAQQHAQRDVRNTWTWLVEQGVQWRPAFPDHEARLVQRSPGERARGWFAGTADLAYVRAGGALLVADWKFGFQTAIVGDPADEHPQLWFLALALATALGLDLSVQSRVVARVELRHVDEDGVRVDGEDLTAGDLLAFATDLERLAERIRGGEAPRVGQACGRCKARASCPAWAALEAEAIEHVHAALPPSLLRDTPQDAEQAAMTWRALQALEGAVPVVRRNVESFARAHGPVPLGMGLELRARVSKGREDALDTPEAIAAAAEVLGLDVSAFARPTTSKGAMVSAWTKKTGKAKTGADARALVKRLREAGVLVEGAPSVRLEVRRAEDDGEEEP